MGNYLEKPEVQGLVTEAVNQRFAHIDSMLHELQKALIRRWLVALIGLIVAAAGIYYVANQSQDTAHQAKVLVVAVANERRDAILSNCRSQNQRNADAIAKLDQVERTSAQRTPDTLIKLFQGAGIHVNQQNAKVLRQLEAAQVRLDTQASIKLINAVVPHQNCQRLIRQQAPTH